MGRGKDGFMGWESNSENRGSEELGFHQTAKSSCFGNNPVQKSSICGVPSERDSTPVTSTTNTFSNSVVESKTMGSSVEALNLSRLADRRDADDLNAPREAPDLSSGDIWGPVRSFRGGVGSVPYCIVHGCMKDLSSSKVYHRRHKVCEIHSKTLNVLVNGIEQRFCQQCSRFHSVTEFDDGKRSCRLRLAGHNERRRKPQRVSHGNKSEKILESYIVSAGRRVHEVPASQATSFGCEDILANNLQHPHKSITNDWSKQRKLDGGSFCYPPLAMPSHGFEKSCPPLDANAVRLESGRESSKNSHRIPRDMEVPRSMSGAIRNDNVIFFDSSSTVQGLSGMSTSGRALSLLSPQSHNSSSYSSGITTAPSLSLSENYFHHHAGQGSEKLLGPGRRQDSTSGLQHKFNSTGMNPTTKGRNSSPILRPDDADDVNSPDEIFQGSKRRKRNDQSSHDNGPTISIQALSSQLQRLEQRRRCMPVNQDKGGS